MLPIQQLSNAVPGAVLTNLYNGTQSTNFGWLSWNGNLSQAALVKSLTPPGNSSSYVNPADSTDHQVDVGDWVSAGPIVSNSKNIQKALNNLKTLDITVPFWDQAHSRGPNASYRVAGFANIRLMNYALPGQNRITVRFLGYSLCWVTNQPPVVSAGPNQTNTFPAIITLDGTVTDDGLPTNGVLTTTWSVVSGPGTVTFSNPNATNTTAAFSQSGVYDLRLTANDGAASTSSDVIVLMNQAPVVNAGSDQVVTNLGATLQGTASDDGLPNGTLTTLWTQVSGPGTAAFADSTNPATTVTFSQTGVYVLQLAADDSLTQTVAQVTITVDAAPIVAVTGDQLVTLPASASLSGTASDDGLPQGSALVYQWSQVSGPGIVSFANATALATSASFSTSGVYVIQFSASDSLMTSAATMTVTANQAPTVSAGPSQVITLPQTATLNGFATDDGLPTGTLTVNWSQASGPGIVTFSDPTNPATTASFSTYGTYILRLTASDGVSTNSATVTITANEAPQAIGQTVTMNEETSQAITLSGTDPDGDPLTYSVVSQPTHGTLSGTPPNLVYQPATNFFGYDGFSFVASDGITDSLPAAVSITVYPVNRTNTPPVVDAGPDLFATSVPAVATLNGQVSDDGLPFPSALQVQWSQISGPGTVSFENPTSAVTSATFSTNGIYVLQLAANDGELQSSNAVEVRVETVCTMSNPAGLTAWWPGNGTPTDVMNGINAVLESGTTYTNGEVALAFNFDGTKDYVWMPAETNYNVGPGTNGFSIEFWMNPNSYQLGSVLGWANGIRLERTTYSYYGDSLRFFVTGSSAGQYVDAPRVWSGTNWNWTHVALTYTPSLGGQARIYINGALAATTTVGTNLMSTATNFYLGQVPGSYYYFSGQLDEVSLYGRTLNPEEIYNLYASGGTGKCPNNGNQAPLVNAGPDLFITDVTAAAALNGQVSDDGLPNGALQVQWSELSGPGTVSFENPTSAVTSATFSTNGIYVLRLTASDGEVQSSSLTEVRVGTTCAMSNPTGLAAWWPGNGADLDVINGYDAIQGGGSNYTNGEVALAFNFDGTKDYVWMPAETNYNVGPGTNGFSIEFWMNPNSYQLGSVLGWANGIRLERTTYSYYGDSLRFFVTGSSAGQYVDAPRVWSGTNWNWTHVALTYTPSLGGQARIYINGALAATATVGTNLMSTATDFYLGQVPGSYYYFSGQLDEVSLYGRTLNPEEIYNLYASGGTGKCPNNGNQAPLVNAGPDLTLTSVTNQATLNGAVSDDGLPNGTLQVQWSELYGPGAVNFSSPTSPTTAATFSTNGIYVLRLTAGDGEVQTSDLVEARVGISCQVQGISGLVAWWPGNGADLDVINGYDAIQGGGSDYTNGEVALAFNFDGTDDYVWMPAETNYNVGPGTNGFSIEFWMNPNSYQLGSVLGWANGIRLERTTYSYYGDSLRFFVTGSSAGQYVDAPRVWSGTNWNWTHVALTYDRSSGVADVYINGLLAATATVGTSVMSTAGDFYLGQVPGSAGYYSGQLDEVSMYNRPLGPAEVESIFAAGSDGKCPGAPAPAASPSPAIALFRSPIIRPGNIASLTTAGPRAQNNQTAVTVQIQPSISVSAGGRSIKLQWSTAASTYILQATTNLSVPFTPFGHSEVTNLAAGVISTTITNSQPRIFFRLQKP